MSFIQKLKFFAFYFWLKWLRIRVGKKKFSDIETRFFAEAAAAADLVRHQDKLTNCSIRDAFWIRGKFCAGSLLPQVESIVISRYLKFGNAILQLTNAITTAKQLGICKIYHRGYDFLDDQITVDGISLCKGIPINENYLASSFFPNQLLGALCKQPESRFKITRKLASFLKFTKDSTFTDDGPEALHIHIRSGDIFSKKNPHPSYGQPPLSFYKTVIHSQNWEKIIIIYEDMRNPVIDKLVNFLSSKNIPHEIQSKNLQQDTARLLNATNIVIGRGTFIYPMLCLSNKVSHVFYFEENGADEWGLEESKIRFIKLVDTEGEYKNTVLSRWLNTDAQRVLMLNYPEEKIAIQH